ncbi:MAG: polysaccharide lyase [Candidatus Bathyarchaeota archaeon]|nr:polysaccharide lyase [Candidatus Bathyarchaeum sp.]
MTTPVKLPKKVLNLFPRWEYRCPDCYTYVESKVSFCPNCETPFEKEGWRVPPRFLKSHEDMSEYAHKVLVPKLSAKQRELLFEYFTEFLNDGFESGGFSAWTTTSGNVAVAESPTHHGSYVMECTPSAWSNAYAQKRNFTTGLTAGYARAYFRWPTIPTGSGSWIMVCRDWTPYTSICEIEVFGTTLRLEDQLNSANYDYTHSFQVDTWYCIEVKAVVNDASNGEFRVWLDGSEVITQTGLDTSGAAEFDSIDIGQRAQQGTAITTYVDCVVVADTYIGPETTEQTYTKTWTTDALFKKLGITQSFNLDIELQKQDVPKTFALDSMLQKGVALQKQIDALFKKPDILKNFTVDTCFGTLTNKTVAMQLDALFKKLNLATDFGLDAYFGAVEAETYTKTVGLDAVFAYKVRLPELWLDENGKIVLNISKPYVWVGT